METLKRTVLGLFIAILLVACGAGDQSSTELEAASAERANGSRGSESAYLSADHPDALSIQAQLAMGTLLLEENELAIDESLAADLLPLWQAVQSLATSETTSRLEIDAVLQQIQETMSPDQISAIAEMKLTEEQLQSMLESGELALGFRGFGPTGGEGSTGGDGAGPSGGGFQGGPGGGFPGGGPGGGPGGFAGSPDPEAIATRQAQFAGSGLLSIEERFLTQAVIRLMETKTGVSTADQPGRFINVVLEVIADASGLTVEEIQIQTQEGTTFAEILESSGADIDAVRESLLQALAELPNAADLDLERMADQWLGLDE